MRVSLGLLLCGSMLRAQVFPFPGPVGSGAPASPTYGYSDVYYSAAGGGGTLTTRAFPATAGQRLLVTGSFTSANAGCGGITPTAQTSGAVSLSTIAFSGGLGGSSGYVCTWFFFLASLPTTQSETVSLSGFTAGPGYITYALMTWTGGTGSLDGTCSGTSTGSSPLSCSSSLTPAATDMVVGVYTNQFDSNNTITSTTLTVPSTKCTSTPGTACGYFSLPGQTGYLTATAIGYSVTASSVTPSFADDTVTGGNPNLLGAMAIK